MPLKQSPTTLMKTFTSGQYRWEVDTTPNAGSPTWEEIKPLTGGTTKFTGITEDDTDFSTGGWKSEFPTGNGWTGGLKGFAKGTGVAPNRVLNPGVAFLLAAGRTLGDDAIVHVRWWRTDEIPEAYEGWATCESSLEDAKPPKMQEWMANLTGKGAPIVITKPESATPASASLKLNGATTFRAAFNNIPTADLTNSSTATQVQTAVQAVTGTGAVTVTGSTGGPYVFANIPASTALTVQSNNGLATFG